MSLPTFLYDIYNHPEFPTNYSKLIKFWKNEEVISGFWDSYSMPNCGTRVLAELFEIFDEYGPELTFPEFKEFVRYKFEVQAGQHIIWETGLDPDELFTGRIPGKNDPEWRRIPLNRKSFRNPELYGHYRVHLDRISGEFEKYYKIRGITLTSPEWALKFKDIQKIPEGNFRIYVTNIVIPDRILGVLEELYLTTFRSNSRIFWPLMTNIISDPEVRDDPEYPLISWQDLFRIEYLTSFLIDKEVERKVLEGFFGQFLKYRKEDIQKWRKYIEEKHPRYRKLLGDADRMKK